MATVLVKINMRSAQSYIMGCVLIYNYMATWVPGAKWHGTYVEAQLVNGWNFGWCMPAGYQPEESWDVLFRILITS